MLPHGPESGWQPPRATQSAAVEASPPVRVGGPRASRTAPGGTGSSARLAPLPIAHPADTWWRSSLGNGRRLALLTGCSPHWSGPSVHAAGQSSAAAPHRHRGAVAQLRQLQARLTNSCNRTCPIWGSAAWVCSSKSYNVAEVADASTWLTTALPNLGHFRYTMSQHGLRVQCALPPVGTALQISSILQEAHDTFSLPPKSVHTLFSSV